MRSEYKVLTALAVIVSTSCDERAPVPRGSAAARTTPAPSCDVAGVREVARQLGERMQRVSLLGPDTIVVRELRQTYAPLVTPELLATWIADPASAPGRKVSSPWPERLEVRSVDEADAGACRVEGEVIYGTSADSVQGGEVLREAVSLSVRLDGGVWRISTYESVTPPSTVPIQ